MKPHLLQEDLLPISPALARFLFWRSPKFHFRKSKAMEKNSVSMNVGNDAVALITIHHPPVNALSMEVVMGLKERYMEAMRRDDVKAIVVTGEGGRFSGGFDLTTIRFLQLQGSGAEGEMQSYTISKDVVDIIEGATKPSVAAIQGLALGGGLELAMSCHARIATPEAQLGLPELSLGTIPGYGGTQRLPRLVGILKAIEMLLSSKPIMSKEGKDLGLIDAVVSSDELLEVSRIWALDIAERRKPWILSLYRTEKLSPISEAREIIKIARQRARQAAPNVPQHQAALDAVEDGIVYGGYVGGLKEATLFKEMTVSSTSKALVHIFFSQRTTSKVPNITDVGLKPRRIQKVAIIGAGLMGCGIATALILRNISVLLKERNSESLERGVKMIAANLQGLATQGKLTQNEADKAMSLLKGVSDYYDFKYVDVVIEAVDETIPVKQSIFSEIEKYCTPLCVLATNTSTIDLNVVEEKTSSQGRIIGAHILSPADAMPLMEIVWTEKTSPQAILDLLTLGKIMNKVPIVVRNCIGLAVDRTFFPYNQASHHLVNLGVDLYRIDKAVISFGMPMGPFLFQDMVGYGETVVAEKIFTSAFPDLTVNGLMEFLVKDGRAGRRNGRGFYLYGKDGKPKPDPSLNAIIEESRRTANIMPGGKPISVSDQEIVEMVFFPAINEACRVMDEGVVVRASDLDIASVFGMGFPPYRGGIIFWADSIGPGYVYKRLKRWAEAYGSFFKPSQFLEERALKGIPLSAPSSNAQGLKTRL